MTNRQRPAKKSKEEKGRKPFYKNLRTAQKNPTQSKTPHTRCELSILPTCRQVPTNLSILSSFNMSVKTRLLATFHLQIYDNLLKQLAASLWITSFDNQLATSLLTTCNRLAVNKLSQAMRTHPDIGLLITSLLQDVNRLVAMLRVFGGVLKILFPKKMSSQN